MIYRFPQHRTPLGIIRGVVITDREIMTRLRQRSCGNLRFQPFHHAYLALYFFSLVES